MISFWERRRKHKIVRILSDWMREQPADVRKRFILMPTPAKLCIRVKDLFRAINEQTEQFEQRLKQRRRLEKQLRDDPLFDRMEDLYYTLTTQILQTLTVCSFECLKDTTYQPRRVLQELMERNQNLLRYYSDYLFALTQATFRDTQQDREMIAQTVLAMADVVREQQTVG